MHQENSGASRGFKIDDTEYLSDGLNTNIDWVNETISMYGWGGELLTVEYLGQKNDGYTYEEVQRILKHVLAFIVSILPWLYLLCWFGSR